jgi:hypothetical protein
MYWIALILPLVIVVAGLVFFVARRAPLASVELSAQGNASASAGRRRSSARLRLTLLLIPTLGGIVVALVIASYRDADGIDGPLGRTSFLMISPLLVTTVIALLLAFVPRFGEKQTRRTAELSRRSPFTFVSRPAATVFIILAGVLIVATTTFGILAWPNGEYLFYFYGGHFAGGGGEFPGFGFGVPILVSLVLLVLAVWLSLFRIARAPRPTDTALREADTAVRILTSSTILAIACFAIAVSLATVLIMAGVAFSDVSHPSVDLHGNPVAINSTARTLAVLSSVGIGVGIGLIVVAIYFLVRSISLATRSPFAIPRKESVGA